MTSPSRPIQNGPLVLCYHAVSAHWPASFSVTPDRLREQVGSLLRRGYRPACFTEAVRSPSGLRTFAVTFDDAFRSVYAIAFPILRDLGVPATLFVPTGHVGGEPMRWPGIEEWAGGAHEAELAGCTWDEIAELAAAGWEVGSHTQSHRRLTMLAEDALDAELRGSKAACEARLGTACTSVAYPYGDYDAGVVAAARRAEYEVGGTLPSHIGDITPLSYPRIYVGHDDDMLRFALKTAPAMRYLRRTPLWDVATRIRPSVPRR